MEGCKTEQRNNEILYKSNPEYTLFEKRVSLAHVALSTKLLFCQW